MELLALWSSSVWSWSSSSPASWTKTTSDPSVASQELSRTLSAYRYLYVGCQESDAYSESSAVPAVQLDKLCPSYSAALSLVICHSSSPAKQKMSVPWAWQFSTSAGSITTPVSIEVGAEEVDEASWAAAMHASAARERT